MGVVPLVIYHSTDAAFTSIAHLVFLQPSLIPHGEQDSANPPAEAHAAYKHILAFVTNPFQKGLSAFLLSLGQPSSSMASLLLLPPAAAGSVPSATSADVPAPLGLSEISDRSFPPHHMLCVTSLGSGQPLGCCYCKGDELRTGCLLAKPHGTAHQLPPAYHCSSCLPF